MSTVGQSAANGSLSGVDGCTCLALFWTFLPCWIGPQDNGRRLSAPVEHSDSFAAKHVVDNQENEAQLNVDAEIISDDYEARLIQQQRHYHLRRQQGCYCGMPTKTATGEFCPNDYKRPAFIDDDRTLAVIKPDAMPHRWQIIDLIKEHGFAIVKERILRMTPEQVGQFYMQNVAKPYYEELKRYISSGPVAVLMLAKRNAVESWRVLMGGRFDVFNSGNHTLRSLFGTDSLHTGLHGSDSYLSAECEIRFFFPEVNIDSQLVGNLNVIDSIRRSTVWQLERQCRQQLQYPTMLTYI